MIEPPNSERVRRVDLGDDIKSLEQLVASYWFADVIPYRDKGSGLLFYVLYLGAINFVLSFPSGDRLDVVPDSPEQLTAMLLADLFHAKINK